MVKGPKGRENWVFEIILIFAFIWWTPSIAFPKGAYKVGALFAVIGRI